LLFLIILCFGHYFPLDVFKLYLRHVPFLGQISQPYKYYTIMIAIMVTWISGGFFDLVRERLGIRISSVLFIAALAAPFSQNSLLYRHAFAVPMPRFEKVKDFFQVRSIPSREAVAWDRETLKRWAEQNRPLREGSLPSNLITVFNLWRGVGVIDWYGHVYLPEHTIPRYYVLPNDEMVENPAYRGEVYFLESENTVESFHTSFETIDVLVTVRVPGTMIVNRNFDSAFRAHRGKLFEHNGLLALKLTEEGSYHVHMKYFPKAAIAILAVSAIIFSIWSALLLIIPG
jgi:hypothetical protein